MLGNRVNYWRDYDRMKCMSDPLPVYRQSRDSVTFLSVH